VITWRKRTLQATPFPLFTVLAIPYLVITGVAGMMGANPASSFSHHSTSFSQKMFRSGRWSNIRTTALAPSTEPEYATQVLKRINSLRLEIIQTRGKKEHFERAIGDFCRAIEEDDESMTEILNLRTDMVELGNDITQSIRTETTVVHEAIDELQTMILENRAGIIGNREGIKRNRPRNGDANGAQKDAPNPAQMSSPRPAQTASCPAQTASCPAQTDLPRSPRSPRSQIAEATASKRDTQSGKAVVRLQDVPSLRADTSVDDTATINSNSSYGQVIVTPSMVASPFGSPSALSQLVTQMAVDRGSPRLSPASSTSEFRTESPPHAPVTAVRKETGYTRVAIERLPQTPAQAFTSIFCRGDSRQASPAGSPR
jgi:hypothetical protein